MSTDEVIDKWTRETENYKDISVTMEQEVPLLPP